ncbi:MAG TPA: hypothetical protein VM305_11570 [Candidatus Limnocylindrales bacterium]|nr:hypothetical protein [Candidatus Limnocylindrales bacterium]
MTSVDQQQSGPASPAPAEAADGGDRDGHGGEQPSGLGGQAESRSPTQAQLRRFIKSRPYVPLHELRRRFELNGDLDEVCGIEVPGGLTVYVGLPERESQLLAGLARDGDIGLELSRDPSVPIVVGVFATRPVARQ